MTTSKYLHIEYADPSNLDDSVVLQFQLRPYSIVSRWVDAVLAAQQLYPIDDPGRFYGFGDLQEQINNSLNHINQCIDIINSHRAIIKRKLLDINDQDTLNYLHHIFEVYHGLLDQQTHEFYTSASLEVQQALANLNLLVHRCESVSRGAKPRHVVTWFGLPKTRLLEEQDYKFFTDTTEFGTVYLNYAEIGKTIEDLAYDNDQYIADEAFQPFRHYSADFNIKFYNAVINRALVDQYYQNHSDFFKQKGLGPEHPYLKSGSIPLADLIGTKDVIQTLSNKQYVKAVSFS